MYLVKNGGQNGLGCILNVLLYFIRLLVRLLGENLVLPIRSTDLKW